MSCSCTWSFKGFLNIFAVLYIILCDIIFYIGHVSLWDVIKSHPISSRAIMNMARKAFPCSFY